MTVSPSSDAAASESGLPSLASDSPTAPSAAASIQSPGGKKKYRHDPPNERPTATTRYRCHLSGGASFDTRDWSNCGASGSCARRSLHRCGAPSAVRSPLLSGRPNRTRCLRSAAPVRLCSERCGAAYRRLGETVGWSSALARCF